MGWLPLVGPEHLFPSQRGEGRSPLAGAEADLSAASSLSPRGLREAGGASQPVFLVSQVHLPSALCRPVCMASWLQPGPVPGAGQSWEGLWDVHMEARWWKGPGDTSPPHSPSESPQPRTQWPGQQRCWGQGVHRVFLLWGQRSPGTGRVPLLLLHREETLG